MSYTSRAQAVDPRWKNATASAAAFLLTRAADALATVGVHRGPGDWPHGRNYPEGAPLSVNGAFLAALAAPHPLHKSKFRDGDWSRIWDRRALYAAERGVVEALGGEDDKEGNWRAILDWANSCPDEEVVGVLRSAASSVAHVGAFCSDCEAPLSWDNRHGGGEFPIGYVSEGGSDRCPAPPGKLGVYHHVVRRDAQGRVRTA